MSAGRAPARERILAAAAAVSREQGAGNLSLDAVAAKAGVSKGGLLYHFPTKAALMRASVESFIDEFEAKLDASVEAEGANGNLLATYVQLTLTECAKSGPGAAGVLAAMADDPDFLKPITAFQRRLLDRLQAETGNAEDVLLIYLALEGLRSLNLFELDILSAGEVELAERAMLRRAARA